MKLLIVGGGGREHALVWRLSSAPEVTEVYCAPGNPGISKLARLVPIGPTDVDELATFARTAAVDLTVVGPELPLAAGLVDCFEAEGLRVVGPRRDAARLETSKAFAKAFMARHRIPTAAFVTCTTPEEARRAVDALGPGAVVKADGLAAGKGVVVAESRQDAERAIDAAMNRREFGEAGATVVIEERLRGEEASFFVLADGARAVPLGTAQDHKRAFDADLGPNTGGMGAFAPSPQIDAALSAKIVREIVEPTLAGLRAEGHPYQGFLYVGLMLTAEGPKVVEYNVRFGDPEAQVVLPMLEDPLLPLLVAAAEGRLPDRIELPVGRPHVGIVLASRGYPERIETGKPISGIAEAEALEDVVVFHAGTAERDGRLVTSGGRVLTVVGRGTSYSDAIQRAYAGAALIDFDGKHMRTDIGRKALS